MADPATLRALLERVKSATGADREIDADLVRTLIPSIANFVGKSEVWSYRGNGVWAKPSLGSSALDVVWNAPAYTGKADDALSLIRREFPDYNVDLRIWGNKDLGDAHADIWHNFIASHRSPGRTPALALLAALLEAKIQEAENDA